ncbi:peptidase M48 Ste24p [Stanieria cyanosphaera PCC 7437]|uniref:Peptidase M48 Ste24p n=1 Tax=Stanieria cyanosphaera (strain ATCC 29371 / PCC 7437) TaxID=111780 RepID=K9XWD1_STAC7|nr:M48 family metallopeptidase [Stanieria cyanosphaera]AFZ36391.1 peptidase M48 Ste24p [Stanieria cyanosphaera PCC 7437]
MIKINLKAIKIYLILFTITLLITLNLVPITSKAQDTDPCTKTLADADQLYLEGDRTAAEQLYRQCKKPYAEDLQATYFPDPITDPNKLSPAGGVYWKNAQGAKERGDDNLLFDLVPKLIEKDPGFVPIYGLLSEINFEEQSEENQTKILEILEQGVTLFPNDADLAMARIEVLRANKQWIDSSIAARQFAIVNPEHPQVKEYQAIADEDLDRFKGDIKTQYIVTGAGGILGGILFGGGDAVAKAGPVVEYARMLIDGESGTGKRLAEGYKEELELIDEPVVHEYIDRIGQDIAKLMGRDEFEYEFYVVKDDAFNAFALPGGKVFINTGAILAAKSEAELAGLIGHEVGHAVLSHGYQGISRASFFNSLNSFVTDSTGLSWSGIAANLADKAYSRQQEKQADIVGARALNAYGYAADGLRNLFQTLDEQSENSPPEYLSTHPSSDNRVEYLEAMIQKNGYNRFAFEGVKEHNEIRQRIATILGS